MALCGASRAEGLWPRRVDGGPLAAVTPEARDGGGAIDEVRWNGRRRRCALIINFQYVQTDKFYNKHNHYFLKGKLRRGRACCNPFRAVFRCLFVSYS